MSQDELKDTSRKFFVSERVSCPECNGVGVFETEESNTYTVVSESGFMSRCVYHCAHCSGTGHVGRHVLLIDALEALGIKE